MAIWHIMLGIGVGVIASIMTMFANRRQLPATSARTQYTEWTPHKENCNNSSGSVSENEECTQHKENCNNSSGSVSENEECTQPTENCINCSGRVSENDMIDLSCGHRIHKKCFLAIMIITEKKCPTCNNPVDV